MSHIEYEYSRGEPFEPGRRYAYSTYSGLPFIDAWKSDRRSLFDPTKECNEPPKSPMPGEWRDGVLNTGEILDHLYYEISDNGLNNSKSKEILDQLVRRFEVFGKFHDQYNTDFRAVDRNQYSSYPFYVRGAEVFEAAYSATGKLNYLNVLLKCMDTLSRLHDQISPSLYPRMNWLAARELEHIRVLAGKVGAPC